MDPIIGLNIYKGEPLESLHAVTVFKHSVDGRDRLVVGRVLMKRSWMVVRITNGLTTCRT